MNYSKKDLVPQQFAEKYKDYEMSDELKEDFKILLNGPSDELYWFSWENVLDEFFIYEEDDMKYTFYQEGGMVKKAAAFID